MVDLPGFVDVALVRSSLTLGPVTDLSKLLNPRFRLRTHASEDAPPGSGKKMTPTNLPLVSGPSAGSDHGFCCEFVPSTIGTAPWCIRMAGTMVLIIQKGQVNTTPTPKKRSSSEIDTRPRSLHTCQASKLPNYSSWAHNSSCHKSGPVRKSRAS